MADLVRAALDEGAIGLSTGLGYAPGVFADIDELVGVTAPLKERGGVYTSHARSYIALGHLDDPDQPPSNLHRARRDRRGVPRARRQGAALAPDLRRRRAPGRPPIACSSTSTACVDEGVDIACDAFPYVGGNTTLVVFMPPWTLTNLRARDHRPRAARSAPPPPSTGCCRTSACAGRTRRSSGCRSASSRTTRA